MVINTLKEFDQITYGYNPDWLMLEEYDGEHVNSDIFRYSFLFRHIPTNKLYKFSYDYGHCIEDYCPEPQFPYAPQEVNAQLIKKDFWEITS